MASAPHGPEEAYRGAPLPADEESRRVTAGEPYAWRLSLAAAKAELVPAWDCLPYDRVAPNGEVMARRIDALTTLASQGEPGRVVITTVNAVLQRVPPRSMFAGTSFANNSYSLPFGNF